MVNCSTIMPAAEHFPLCQEPIQIAGHTVRNRIVRSSHGSNMNSLDGFPTEEWIVYQETRASGGVGLSIIELGPAGVGGVQARLGRLGRERRLVTDLAYGEGRGYPCDQCRCLLVRSAARSASPSATADTSAAC